MATNIIVRHGDGSAGEETPEQKIRTINRAMEEKETIARAKKQGLSYVDIGNLPINIDLLYIVPEEVARKGQLMPFFKVGKKLRVAVFDPEFPATKDAISNFKRNGYLINISIASKSGIEDALEVYKSEVFKAKKVIENVIDVEHLASYETEILNLEKLESDIPNMPAEEAANMILVGGIKTSASDVHLEPYDRATKIRYRIDGVLQDIFELPPDIGAQLTIQLKHQAHMKLNINNRPQDGRFSFFVNQQKIDVRVSTLPTIFGETLVMRLLESERKLLGLEGLGLQRQALQEVTKALKEPFGMILATGPTGSGKTTTLYSMLQLINTPELNVITLEEPVEYRVFGITQSQVDPESDYTFAKGLRAILRQDPDIVMVGEIRDLETAETSCQAALTGHIVLATLHTNDAVSSIPRLLNMGLKPYMIAPSINTVIAQRLVRRICPKCHELTALQGEELEIFQKGLKKLNEILKEKYAAPKQTVSPVGCDFCSHTGFKGQLGLFEVLLVSPEIERMVLEGKGQQDIFEVARKNGMLTLREDGILRVLDGTTTMNEVLRVTGEHLLE